MLLTAVPEEVYCLRTNTHSPIKQGSNIICYRCGIMLGRAQESHLGTLLDY